MCERKMIVQCGAVLGNVPIITRCEALGLCLLQSKLEADRFWTKYIVPSSQSPVSPASTGMSVNIRQSNRFGLGLP